MPDVPELMRHIRQRDALADDSAVALALLIEAGCKQPAAGSGTEEAVRELRHYVSETPAPLPSAVWALGKAHDPMLAETLASVLVRALDTCGADDAPAPARHADAPALAHQALAALTVLPVDTVPVDTVRLAAAKGPADVRQLANDWLRLLQR